MHKIVNDPLPVTILHVVAVEVAEVSMSRRKAVSCGRDLTCVPDLFAALETAGQCG